MKPKSKSQIIAEQESIGNVEISKEEFNNLNFNECFYIPLSFTEALYFVPREVVHPEEKIGCGEDVCANCGLDISQHYGDYCPEQINGESYKKFVPSCQKKQDAKDNHSPHSEASCSEDNPMLKRTEIAEEPEVNLCKDHKQKFGEEMSGSDIQQFKIFEDILGLIDEKFSEAKFKTYCGFELWLKSDIEDLKLKIKEKWGKIE
jgi:hypothetical protein